MEEQLKKKIKKTKVCIDCGRRKKLSEFHKQSHKGHKVYSSDGHRTDCKKCQHRKSVNAYKRRTTPEQRREYMRNYLKTYIRK